MNKEISLIDTNNYATMAQAMGMVTGEKNDKKENLPRLRMIHKGFMGEKIVEGETVKVEVIAAGSYRLELPNGDYVYSKTVTIRPFVQRFMYKRWIQNNAAQAGEKQGDYCKTVMADNLNMDLKDNMGGFNCGKPAGYVKDFQSLPEATQKLIKEIKRNRVILGLIKLDKPMDETGKKVKQDEVPFIYEIDNREAFKTMGEPFIRLSEMKRLPPQHNIKLTAVQGKSRTGTVVFYLPVAELDISKVVDITDEDQASFSLFLEFIQTCNDSVIKSWDFKNKNIMKQVDKDVVDDFIDIETDGDII